MQNTVAFRLVVKLAAETATKFHEEPPKGGWLEYAT